MRLGNMMGGADTCFLEIIQASKSRKDDAARRLQ
jgi:hypothetical protein